MKYFIAFMLLLLTNCLVPTHISAVINPKNSISKPIIITHKTMIYEKKISYSERSKQLPKKSKKITLLLIVGVLLMLAGLILVLMGVRETKISPNDFDVLKEYAFGMTFFGSGVILSIIAIFKRNKKAKSIS